uniref:Uncharacterized protein n=1 Tax=Anopheles atroparvus TaxID=41427 RepID=A0A182JFS9_ANOAO
MESYSEFMLRYIGHNTIRILDDQIRGAVGGGGVATIAAWRLLLLLLLLLIRFAVRGGHVDRSPFLLLGDALALGLFLGFDTLALQLGQTFGFLARQSTPLSQGCLGLLLCVDALRNHGSGHRITTQCRSVHGQTGVVRFVHFRHRSN